MKAAPIVTWIALLMLAVTAITAQTKINFDKDKIGVPPTHFTTALTGQGKPGVWIVMADSAQGNVLAQMDADATGYRFPLCVYEKLVVKNADLSVKFKTVSGEKDQVAGLLWRYRDKDNYYLMRANALEHNIVLYKMQNGKREALPLKGGINSYGKKAKVAAGQWHTLRVVVTDNLFTVYLNGTKLYDVEDSTFSEAGKIGVWTKADSVTYFDDLQIKKQ
ncbi:MAG: DUF1080 domain-containing protein [Blastocatellia bacterium]|nr:DUF1080 domain-containing protein [Blastocatellia bacterium]